MKMHNWKAICIINFIDPYRMTFLLTGTNVLITGTNTVKFLATFFGN